MSDQGVTGGDVWILPASSPPPAASPSTSLPTAPPPPHGSHGATMSTSIVSELAGGDSPRRSRLRIPQDRIRARSLRSTHLQRPRLRRRRSHFEPASPPSADRSLFVFQASTFDHAAGNLRRTAPPRMPLLRSTSAEGFAGLIQLSHFNDGLKPSWGDSVSLDWTNENFNIQGWLLLPAHYDPAKKYPLIVEVHGGPASSVLSSWDGGAGGFSATAFSALGYFVLMPNPRGSYGQGEAFTQANRKDFGYGDLRDILAGVDTVLAKYPVDPNRVGIAGWSYGGFMTMFAVTQTHRFRAAVAGAGISDWLSYYGENSIDQWMIPYFGASVYDDPADLRKKLRHHLHQTSVNTPTLTLVGDRDGECPAPQSFEFWHALRDLHVPAQLVVYPNEGHGFSDPADRRDVLERAVDWFARYMPPSQRNALMLANASLLLARSLVACPSFPVFPARQPPPRQSIWQSLIASRSDARGGPILIHFFLGAFTVRFAFRPHAAACRRDPSAGLRLACRSTDCGHGRWAVITHFSLRAFSNPFRGSTARDGEDSCGGSLTLVCLLGLALPAGISISGCVRNPAGNYCNGLGYGLKDTDVANHHPAAADRRHFAGLRTDNPDSSSPRHTCKGNPASISAGSLSYGTTNNQLVDISPRAASAPAPGIATPAAASPTTPTAIFPIHCHRQAACPTPSPTSLHQPMQSPPIPSRSTFTRLSPASIW